MTASLRVFIKSEAKGVVDVPKYQTEGAAGFDLQAAIGHHLIVQAGSRNLVPTGLVVEIPQGYEAQVRSRSGMALKHGVCVLNSPGTIDSDYRGEIAVILHNTGGIPFMVKPGDRIAQLVIAPVVQPLIELIADAEHLSPTGRGEGGFGSTGT